MTVPMLTQALTEPAKHQSASKRDGAHQTASEDAPGRDFAALIDGRMADAPDNRATAPAAAQGDASGKVPDKGPAPLGETGEDARHIGDPRLEETALGDPQQEVRKKVFIPELPTPPAQPPAGRDGAQKDGLQKTALPTDAPVWTGTQPPMQVAKESPAATTSPMATSLPLARGKADVVADPVPLKASAMQPDSPPKHTVSAANVTQGAQAEVTAVATKVTATGTAVTATSTAAAPTAAATALTAAATAKQPGAAATSMPTDMPDTRLERGHPESLARREEGAVLQSRPVDLAAKSAHIAAPTQQMVAAKNRDIVETRATVQDAREVSARRYDAAPPVMAQAIQAPQTIPMAPQMAMLQPVLQQALAEKQAQSLHGDGDVESLQFDLRGTNSTQQTGTTPPPMRADLPRSIAAQISDFVRAKPDKPVDVSLNPEELGRVRLSVSTAEGGVVLSILAERPETLELMRRHADILARELSQLGFGSVDLAFGEGRDPGESQADTSDRERSERPHLNLALSDTAEITSQPTASQPTYATGGLDIRI